MDAAVALPLPATLPPPHLNHHRALPPRRHSSAAAAAPPKAPAPAAPRLSLAARPLSPARSASSAAPARSSRAATGYAAALADACARAGTLRRAARNARALLSRRHGDRASSEEDEELDARVAALVRMLVGKGKAGMVAEALAEFAAICDHLLPPPARHAY